MFLHNIKYYTLATLFEKIASKDFKLKFLTELDGFRHTLNDYLINEILCKI